MKKIISLFFVLLCSVAYADESDFDHDMRVLRKAMGRDWNSTEWNRPAVTSVEGFSNRDGDLEIHFKAGTRGANRDRSGVAIYDRHGDFVEGSLSYWYFGNKMKQELAQNFTDDIYFFSPRSR